MNKVVCLCLFSLIAIVNALPIHAEQLSGLQWRWTSVGIVESEIQDIVFGKDESELFCISNFACYRSKDNGLTWERTYRLPGASERVNTATTEQSRATGAEERKYIDVNDLDLLKELGLIEDWVEDLNDLDEDIYRIIHRAGYYAEDERKDIESESESEPGSETIPTEQKSTPAYSHQLYFLKQSGILTIYGQSGFYISQDSGRTWRENPSGLGDAASRVTAFTGDEAKLYAVANDKLYESTDKGLSWNQKITLPFQKIHTIFMISEAPQKRSLIMTSESKVLIYDGSESLREIYTSTGRGNDEIISCYVKEPSTLLIVCKGTIKLKRSIETAWEDISFLGLPANAINHVTALNDAQMTIVGYGSKGIYLFDTSTQRWQDVSDGLRQNTLISRVLFTTQTIGYAATERGVYTTHSEQKAATGLPISLKDRILVLKDEPTLQEVHAAALRYAYYDVEEYRNFYSSARWCNLVPETDIALDMLIKDSERLATTRMIELSDGTVVWAPDNYTYTNRDQTDYLFSINLKWEPGRIWYNRDLLNVSNRVQSLEKKRNKLLNQVDKLYQQRQDILYATHIEKSDNPAIQASLLLQLDEVTAFLNALTGGIYVKKE